MTSKPSISIVIPALNEEGFIKGILSDLMLQDGYLEIIVNDSGSEDKTTEIVKTFIRDYPHKNIRLLEISQKGPAASRNHGAKNAKGTYILFLDADTRVPENFLKNIAEEMTERKLDIAGCFFTTSSPKKIDRFMFFLQKFFLHYPLQYTKHPGCVGAGIMVKKELHEKIDGFDEKLSFSEDLDYAKRAIKKGLFRMIRSTHVIFSMRRFDQEGRLRIWTKYLKGGVCYIFNIKNYKVEYKFGTFGSKEKQKNPGTFDINASASYPLTAKNKKKHGP